VIATFAFANLRVGAQLMFVPAARVALALSIVIAVGAMIWAIAQGRVSPGARPIAPA
jgi:hypothetical protein